jgi:hypothetical protein
LRVDSRYFVVSRHRGEEPLDLRHSPDAMNTREAANIGKYLSTCRIKYDQVVGIHVRDVQPARSRIEALVIEPNCRAG